MRADHEQMKTRQNRREAMLTATRALCNTCGQITDAKLVTRDDRVWLVKWCADHGRTEALVSSDIDWYLRSLAFIKPGTNPKQRTVTTNESPCPDNCGLCENHMQHTCVPILEITDRCNMDCPVCLVEGHNEQHLTLEQVDAIVDNLVACEGQLNMLNLSGGEPTVHPQFLELVDRIIARPEVGVVSVSTNGIRLARDTGLVEQLAKRNVVISLQLDGFDPQASLTLRGRADLPEIKRQVIDKVIAANGRLSLTVTLAKGVNEDALADALPLLFEHEQVLSLMVQPLSRAGTQYGALPAVVDDLLTMPDVVKLLAEQSGGVLSESDFSPLPCSHPTCFALTYLLKTEAGGLVSLPSIVNPDDYLDIIKNQALLGTDWETLEKLKDALYDLWTGDGQIPDREGVLATVKTILLNLNEVGAGTSHREVLDLGTRNVKSIFIHDFMDRATFDLSRAVKCCNHYPQADGRLLPACVRNCVGG